MPAGKKGGWGRSKTGRRGGGGGRKNDGSILVNKKDSNCRRWIDNKALKKKGEKEFPSKVERIVRDERGGLK